MSMITELIDRLRQHADTFEQSGFAVDGLIKDYREAADTIQFLYEKLNALQTKPCEDRNNCPHRHENGNCLSVGGFCLAVDDQHCQLKKEPCGKDINVTTTDAISRQAAIDCVSYDVEYSIECLEALPSVTPVCEERIKGECPYYAG